MINFGEPSQPKPEMELSLFCVVIILFCLLFQSCPLLVII